MLRLKDIADKTGIKLSPFISKCFSKCTTISKVPTIVMPSF
jgi:hypothetical protein